MATKIIDYTVISAINSMELSEGVNALISDGWEPLGGVCLAYERNVHREVDDPRLLVNDFEHYAQALVKYE